MKFDKLKSKYDKLISHNKKNKLN